MESSWVGGRTRRLGAFAAALGAAMLLPVASPAFDIGDNFNDNRVNKAIWGKYDFYHNGILTETNKRLEYTVTATTGFDLRGRRMIWGTGPYSADWETQIDVANALALVRDRQYGAFGLWVIKCGDPYDEMYVENYAVRYQGTTYKGFYAAAWSNDEKSGSADHYRKNARAQRGTVKLSFDATAKVLTAAYDIGHGWMTLGSFGVIPGAGSDGSGDWGMTDADAFCIEVYGNSMSMAVPGGRLVGDNFLATGLLPSKILLLQPNGGEVIPSGLDSYTITWYRPPDVDSVRLQYSLDKGSTWQGIEIDPARLTADSYDWRVPTPLGNKTGCLVKVSAFNAADRQIGSDSSDRPFTIKVVRLTAPGAGVSPLVSGTTSTITWTTNGTAALVERVLLAYTLDGGVTWRAIDTSGDPSDDGSFDWTVPPVRLAENRCKVRVTLKDATNRTVGSDVSDGFFRVEPAP